mmetsp:Transcript_14781/g.33789  ORF Transcript_14781/g.33789 Transcript_14781/m.33789 type:complete len:224 (-) Transcript_14781:141-812(-)
MGASRLYGVEIPVGEEEFCDEIPSIRVVAEQEERPVHQPRALLQLHDGRCVSTRLNRLLERVDVLKRLIPVGHQDFASELAPLCRESVFGVGREEPERDKQVGRVAIVAAVVNKLGVPLERLHVSGSDRVLLLQERLVEQLLTLKIVHATSVLHELEDGLHLVRELRHEADHLLAPVAHVLRDVGGGMQSLIYIHRQIHHVRAEENLQLATVKLICWVCLLFS